MKKIGRQVNMITTTPHNPRNGEGSFIQLRNGTIMFAYTEFFDSNEDEATSQIAVTFSEDEGETWTEKEILFQKPVNAVNIMSLSFLRMNNGDIGAFYIEKSTDSTDKIMFTRSSDEGKSWSEPVNCLGILEKPDYYILNNDRPIKLKNGRILLPLARHTVYTDKDCFMPGEICFLYSDDDGESWHKTEQELICPFPDDPNGFQEPGVFELEDGRIKCYIRTGLGFQFEAFSYDFGETWTLPQPNLFFSSPCSPMHIKNWGDLSVAVFNPIPEHILRNDDKEFWGRTPYTIAVSYDKGLTFTQENLYYLEDDLSNGYCYPAIYDGGNYLLIAYYHSNGGEICLNCTKIIKINRNDIL